MRPANQTSAPFVQVDMKRSYISVSLLAALAAYGVTDVRLGGVARAPAQGYVNGVWFDGAAFVPRAVVVADGELQFVERLPSGVDAVDLAGGYVVPPYCEAHNHNIGVGKPEERNKKYFDAGVFYVQSLTDAPQLAAAERAFWSQPDSVHVAFAHGGLTGPGGHPIELLEGIKRGGGYPPGTELANQAYFEAAAPSDVDRHWPSLVAAEPHIVKLYLQYSEEYERRVSNAEFFGKRGLSPASFRRAVELARRDRRRVAVHVTSAADFHLAVDAGVDVIAHLPGYMSVESISVGDAELAARKKIAVITTASLARSFASASMPLERLRAAQIANLKTLRDAGVTLTIGSDSWADSSHAEAAYLRGLGVFQDVELLRMWTMTCPTVVFPDRTVGRLAPGHAASFLVLGGDPLKDWAMTRSIKYRRLQHSQ